MANKRLRNSGDGHETHTTALVLMVLFTGLVLTIALGDTNSLSVADEKASSSDNTAEQRQPLPAQNSGSGQVAAAADPLTTLPVEPDVEVTNEMTTRGAQAIEQVISYETTRSSANLAMIYQDWLRDNDYTTEKQKVGSRAASFAATRGDSALIVMISYLSASDRSRVEIINYRR